MNDSSSDPPAILLVDDEPEILHSLKGLLRREFSLHTAENGDQALQILREFPIQVLMTDQRMPEMSGSELLRHAIRVSPDTLQIIFTGYADIRAIVEAVNRGGLYRYITKPWDPDDLIETLTDATKEYQRRQSRKLVLHDAQRFFQRALQNELDANLRDEAAGILQRLEALPNEEPED